MTEIKLTPAQGNWLEATWTNVEQLPDQAITLPQQELAPGVADLAMRTQVVPGGEKRTELKHVSYHPTQLDLLQADAAAMGTPLDAHDEMLALWVASYVPEPVKEAPAPGVPSAAELQRQLSLISAQLRELTFHAEVS